MGTSGWNETAQWRILGSCGVFRLPGVLLLPFLLCLIVQAFLVVWAWLWRGQQGSPFINFSGFDFFFYLQPMSGSALGYWPFFSPTGPQEALRSFLSPLWGFILPRPDHFFIAAIPSKAF